MYDVEVDRLTNKLAEVTKEHFGSYSYPTGYFASLLANVATKLNDRDRELLLANLQGCINEYSEK